ncbi:MAG: outer membrane protein assembly factor BamE [Rhodobacterales bacterium]|nr:outer membrane protein assembly factor BamE [Rhodobacterales bacterium]
MGSHDAGPRSRVRASRPVAGGLRRAALAALLTFAVAGCTPLFRNHGYVPPESDLAAISVGVDTRETVIAAIGAPTSTGVIAGGDLYYVTSRFRLMGPFEPREVERQVLAVSFDANGILRNVERFGLADGQVVTLSRRVTDDNIRDVSFLRQLFGNVGNFDASTLLGGG